MQGLEDYRQIYAQERSGTGATRSCEISTNEGLRPKQSLTDYQSLRRTFMTVILLSAQCFKTNSRANVSQPKQEKLASICLCSREVEPIRQIQRMKFKTLSSTILITQFHEILIELWVHTQQASSTRRAH